jgi:hypothetical protein
MDWTHGKVLAEKRPDIVRDPKDWHQELSCDRLGRSCERVHLLLEDSVGGDTECSMLKPLRR